MGKRFIKTENRLRHCFADRAKIVLSGEIKKAYSLKGIGATKGAKEAIEKAGGTVEALPEPPKPAKLTAKK